jgi:hypothetical protein
MILDLSFRTGPCMSTATTTETTLTSSLTAKFRKSVVGAGFAISLLAPKALNLRRNENSWTIFRTILGFFGAALVVLPIGFFSSYFLAVIGLGIFIAAILLPPAKSTTCAEDKAAELGALAVVNGGLLHAAGLPAVPVQLFVGSENLWAVQSADFHPVLMIAAPELISARAEETLDGWIFRINWANHTAAFSYSGLFAEHLARNAESTVRSIMSFAPVAAPRTRAARA